MTTSKTPLQPLTLSLQDDSPFDKYTLRRAVGTIAFSFPFIIWIRAWAITSSISASYYTEARDIFVGGLFVIGILFIGYKGHKPDDIRQEKVGPIWKFIGGLMNWVSTPWRAPETDYRVKGRKNEEDLVSTLGGLAAMITALYPTACDTCTTDITSSIHYLSAGILFSTVVYFCLFAFLRQVIKKWIRFEGGGVLKFLRTLKDAYTKGGELWSNHSKKKLRGIIYIVCGWLVIMMMISLLGATLTLPKAIMNAYHITFWAETIAMWAFGIAWLTAYQWEFLLDDDEMKHVRASK